MLQEIAAAFGEKSEAVDTWLTKQAPPPLYSSFDMRNSGFKTAVVDANVFPAGFNNLCQPSKERVQHAFKTYLNEKHSDINNVLLVSESHTRNTFYLENLYTLQNLLQNAGFQVKIGAFSDIVHESIEKETAEGHTIVLNEIQRKKGRACVSGFDPDIVILNNDLSRGVRSVLDGIEQPIEPETTLGWWNRSKYKHLSLHEKLTKKFGSIVGLDPWLIRPYFEGVPDVDFIKKTNFEEVAEKIDTMIACIERKYNEHGVKEKPYVFVKADRGTYGMNVMHFFSGKEFLKLNSKNRRKMAKRKGSEPVRWVLVQEGIKTVDVVENVIGEPVVYNVGTEPVGGFFRTNAAHDPISNLNTSGMNFTNKMLCELWTDKAARNPHSNLTDDHLLVYRTLARLSAAAIGQEII